MSLTEPKKIKLLKKIYITGFNGYLGSALCPLLKNYSLVKIGNPDSKKRDENVLYSVPKKIEKNSICIHLASISGELSESNRKKTYDTNVVLTKKLCYLGFEKFFFISSSSVYGNSDKPFLEDSDLNPSSYYSETKILSEEIVKKIKKNIILRMSILMGISPRTNWKMFINSIIKNINENKKSDIYGLETYRPYLNVNDAAEGLCKIITNKEVCGIFNFGFSDMNFNKMDIIKKIMNKYPSSKFNTKKNLDNPNYPTTKRSYKLNCEKIEKIIDKKRDLNFTIQEIADVF